MSDLQAVERLRAWVEGRPLPVGSTLCLNRASAAEVMVVAVVRMAAETSPWAIAWGRPNAPPKVASVPDPRRADDVRTMLMPFATDLLRHFGHPAHGGAIDAARVQLVMPGASHVEMLHLLEYRYAFAKKVPEEEIDTVNAFGRLCGWLFREAHRPHQTSVLDVTRALREAWAIPAEDMRLQHLGFVLAWLSGRGDRAAREALAEAAEQQTVGATMAPAVDKHLEPFVDRWNTARTHASSDPTASAHIKAAVEDEVSRRWALAVEGWQRLQRDARPTHPGMAALEGISRDEYAWQWRAGEVKRHAGEDSFVPAPETDRHAPSAASRFFAHQRAAELGDAAMMRGDRDLLASAVLDGSALLGTIAAVDDEGSGRVTLPVWTLDAAVDTPTRLREGSKIEVAQMSGRVARVRSIEQVGGRRRVVLEIVGRKTATAGLPHGADPALVGMKVALVPSADGEIARRKSFAVRKGEGPGAWLTHGAERAPEDPPARRQKNLVDLVEGLGGR